MASTFNTLQRRELFSLSPCKCFSTSTIPSLHNSFAFSSPKHVLSLKLSPLYLDKAPVTVKTHTNDRILSSLNCHSSTETVDFIDNNEILDSGHSSSGFKVDRGFLDDSRKGRKHGDSFNFGKKSENGSELSSIRRNSRSGERKGEEKVANNSNGILGSGYSSSVFKDDRVGEGGNERRFVDNGRKGRNNSSEFFNNGKRSENGTKISSFRRGRRSGERKMQEKVDEDARKDHDVSRNRGHNTHRGPWFPSKKLKEANSTCVVVNGSIDRGAKKDDDEGSYKVNKKEKFSKKKKPNSPEFKLRVGLDMCSKKGDVVGAISLYDSAVKQGVRMAQYHYTVLLYLCSSAAVGVVRPAKSGSGSRSLDTVAPSNVDETSLSIEEEDDDGDNSDDEVLDVKDQIQKLEVNEIRVSEDVKTYARERGFEIYEKMCLDKVQMNEAALTSVARMAMAMGDGDMAFDVVKKMKSMGISPKLRSYGPALSVFSSNGEVEKAFSVEEHMLENGVDPEEPELEALLRVSVETSKADRVYYVLHKLRTNVRSVSPTSADLIEKWFKSKEASRVGKRKWDHDIIAQTMENVGGGWHGEGWLGRGKWSVSRSSIGADGLCKCCQEKLALIDLDPEETERFAESVATIAIKREKNSSFQKFQRWLDYYGPFEAVVDAANVGLYSQRNFKPSKVNVVVNGIRQMHPSRKWPLIVLHNRRVTGGKLDKPIDKDLVERWRNADALYATPTGSNDDWYWLYAAIRFKCLLVTNDEMRDHTFQLLGNDFFPKWKERHQVRFSFSELGPVFHMPPPCSVVIQESDRGHWHIPIASEHQSEEKRTWLCITRPKSLLRSKSHIVDREDVAEDSEEETKDESQSGSSRSQTSHQVKAPLTAHSKLEAEETRPISHNDFRNKHVKSTSSKANRLPILKALKTAEEHAGYVIDFQI